MKQLISFDFWQKLGKALMVVIAVMPAAGLMISIGKLIGMSAGDVGILLTKPTYLVRSRHRWLMGKR